jgi:hypothetical protein
MLGLREGAMSESTPKSVLLDARRFNWLGLKEYGLLRLPNLCRFDVALGPKTQDRTYRDKVTGRTSTSFREIVDLAMQDSPKLGIVQAVKDEIAATGSDRYWSLRINGLSVETRCALFDQTHDSAEDTVVMRYCTQGNEIMKRIFRGADE